ncbi:MAG: type II-A CRISPR-associated protein Csn2 [Eubacteriales bacterium]
MKIACPYFNTVIDIEDGTPFSLVIENQRLFRTFLEDLSRQACGEDGKTVLSLDDVPISVEKYVDIIKDFAPFEINTKSMLSKINSFIEKIAVDESHFLKTSELLSETERYINDLCFDLPFQIECRKLSASSIIKAASVSICDDYESTLEAVLDYMSLVLDFDKKKLFVTVNLRSYFSDDEMQRFVDTVCAKQMQVLFLESSEHATLKGVQTLRIDKDLCEF